MSENALVATVIGIVGLAIVCIVALSVYGSALQAQRHADIGRRCIAAGGSWVPSGADDRLCIAPRTEAVHP